jgi:hypothetical protein
MKLLLTTVATILMATTSFSADLGASVEMKVAENETTDKYEATTTIGIDVDAGEGVATLGLDFESVDGDTIELDKWHVGTEVADATVTFGDQDGIFVEATSDFSSIAEPTIDESLALSYGPAAVAVGFTDITTDVTEVSNVQLAYNVDLVVADVTASMDYNRTSEEYTWGARVDTVEVTGVALGTTVSYETDTFAYELDSTVSTYGLTTYINGDEDDLLENVGVGHEFGFSDVVVETDVNYNVDDETVTPSVTLSFAF